MPGVASKVWNMNMAHGDDMKLPCSSLLEMEL